jgi:hypothetical protein
VLQDRAQVVPRNHQNHQAVGRKRWQLLIDGSRWVELVDGRLHPRVGGVSQFARLEAPQGLAQAPALHGVDGAPDESNLVVGQALRVGDGTKALRPVGYCATVARLVVAFKRLVVGCAVRVDRRFVNAAATCSVIAGVCSFVRAAVSTVTRTLRRWWAHLLAL